MENLHAQIIDYLLTQSWQIGVLAVAIAAVSLAVKNKSAHVRYLLWLIVLAKCLVPPLYTITLAVLPQQEIPEPVVTTPVEMPVVEVEAVEVMQGEPVTLPSRTVLAPPVEPSIAERLAEVTVRQWLAFVWIIGVGVFVLAAVIKALRVNQWLRRERRALPAKLQSGIEKLFAELGVKTVPKVWLVEGIGQPFVWGLLRGGIYLPGNFAGVKSDEERRGVLGHELSHVLRFDAAVNLLQIIAQAIFWFHPFVWWANKRIRAEREKCCDEMAIARLGAKAKDYSSAIVNTLIAEHEAALPIPSLAVAGPVKNIEDRIKTIMNPGKKFYKRPSLIAAMAVLVLALIAVPTTLALTAREAKSPEKIDVETILEKVRKAQRPAENMRIEWVRETDLAHYWGWTKKRRPTKEPVIEKSNAVISGKRSRIERREEYYEGEVAGEPLRVQYATSVFDGNEQRRLNELGKGYERGGKSGYIALEERNTSLLKELLFGSNPLQHSKGRLEEYKFKLELLENEVPGIYVLKITKPEGQLYDLITVDGNRGYNIVKRELVRSSDDVKLLGDDYELKRYTNGIWFLSKREKVRYTSGLDVLAKPRLEEKITITNVQFDMPEPDGKMFKLEFPAETKVRILGSEIAISEDGEEELRQVIESAKKLQGLGKALIIYANEDEEGKLPDTLQQLHKEDYVSEKDLEWFLANIEYLGKGMTAADPPDTMIAFDKALLEKGKGTNVLFLDGHVAFKSPGQLEKLGIAGEPAWGEPVEGLAVRLRPEKLKWLVGEPPTFMLDIRNRGTRQVRVVRDEGACEVLYDGQAYRWAPEVLYEGQWHRWPHVLGVKSSPLGPGREYTDIPISLNYRWVIKTKYKPIPLREGRHTVRVAFTAEPDDPTKGEAVHVLSNPVEIEIVPLKKKVAWGKVVNNLQLGLAFDGEKRTCTLGEELTLQIYVCNTGDSEVPLSWVDLGLKRPSVVDSKGWSVPHWEVIEGSAALSGGGIYLIPNNTVLLQPGDIRMLGETYYRDMLDPGKYRISQSCEFSIGWRPKEGKGYWSDLLTTGKLELVVDAGAKPAWGEAVDGVRCRLRATKRVWEVGERPTFSLDVRNDYGDSPIRVEVSGSRPCYEIEYDGRWYGYTGQGIIRGFLYVMDLAPGEETPGAVGVDFPGVWVTPVPPNDGKPQKLLDFSPGTHEVRVRLYLERQTQDRGAGVVSNPVEIEILPWGGTAGKGEAVREKPSVWLTVLPKSPIRSLNEYEHWIRTDPRPTAPLYKPVPVPACDFEIRRASDQQRVARIPLGESFVGTGELTQSARRRFGWLGNGEYLVALCIGYWRCSNVSRLTLDSDFDGSVEPTLSLVSLEAAPGGKLPFLGIRAVGPTPQDAKLTNETIAFPKLVVDGVERNLKTLKWAGPVAPLESGKIYTRILDLDGYEPAIEPGKEHTVKAIVGKYESVSVVIPADNLLGQQWDIATKKLPPVPPPMIVLEGKVTGLEGKVAEGYQVSLSNLSGSVFKGSTKQDGTYQFINVPPGKYSLVCHLKGKGMPDLEIENVQIHEGETLTVDMNLHRKYILSGTVSYEDGRPAANTGVWLSCEDQQKNAEFNDYTAADANGCYELGGPFGTVSYIGIKGKRIEGSMPRLEPGRTELRFILRKNEAGRYVAHPTGLPLLK